MAELTLPAGLSGVTAISAGWAHTIAIVPPHLVVAGLMNPYVAGAAHTVSVTVKDFYGYMVPAYRGTIHFTSSDASATVPADYTFTYGDGGVHVFSLAVTLRTVGSQAVRARDTSAAFTTGIQSGILVRAVFLHTGR